MTGPPILVKGIQRSCCPQARWKQQLWFRLSVLTLTYVSYMMYHASRRPISIVKNDVSFLDCNENAVNKTGVTCKSWITEIDGKSEEEAKSLIGLLETTYLISYAIFMFFSGFVAERMDLRFFLSMGMMLSGLLCVLFGIAYPLGIHSIWYLIFIQIVTGMVQSTGWPGVVTAMGNWFGKGKRGLLMGIWNSHTSLGNIVGGLVAGSFVSSNWGLAFTVPGIMIGGFGFIIFLFLVPSPEDVDLGPAEGTRNSVSNVEVDPLLNSQITDEENNEPDERVETQSLNSSAHGSSAIGFIGALKIPGVIEFSLCLFFAKMVSYIYLYWLPNYIHVQSHLNADESAVLSTTFDWGGVVGGIFAGVLSDKTKMSATTCTIMLSVAIPVIYLNQQMFSDICPLSEEGGIPIHDSCFVWTNVVLFITGLLVNGPYALITTAVSAELGQHPSLSGSAKALSTVTAIIDGTGSLGTTASFIVGPLSSNDHWENVIYLLMAADVCAMILLIRLVKNEMVRLRNRGWKLFVSE